MRRMTLFVLHAALLLIAVASSHGFAAAAEKKKQPVRVFVLAGQSNMQGHAHVRTLGHIGMDPQTAPILREIRNADGTPRVHQHVWISSIDSNAKDAERHGRLTTGYGASGREQKIGPELTFGITMHKHVGGPVLIIKTAWGGKSLHTDFRPPTAGPYRFNDQQLEKLKKQGKDIEGARADRARATGVYYRLMMTHIKKVLGDIKRVVPDYDARRGHRLAGFVWFQGHKDSYTEALIVEYEKNLVNLINDARNMGKRFDLVAATMVTIGVIGIVLDLLIRRLENFDEVRWGYVKR